MCCNTCRSCLFKGKNTFRWQNVNVPSASVNGTGWIIIVEVNFRLFSLEIDLCKEQFWLSSILKWYSLCRFLSVSGDLHVILGVTAVWKSVSDNLTMLMSSFISLVFCSCWLKVALVFTSESLSLFRVIVSKFHIFVHNNT